MYQGKTSTKTACGKKNPVANGSNLASKCETATNTTGHCSYIGSIHRQLHEPTEYTKNACNIVTFTLQLDAKHLY